MYSPSLEQIRTFRDQGNLCPIYREILADLETPVSAFLKVAHGPWAFLLESVEAGQQVGRYSFIGADPYMTITFHEGTATIMQGGHQQSVPYNDPLRLLGSYLSSYQPVRLAAAIRQVVDGNVIRPGLGRGEVQQRIATIVVSAGGQHLAGPVR